MVYKGASGCLNVLLLEDDGSYLNKDEFRDVGPDLRIPSGYSCGKSFNPSHAMDCKKGFVHARHDN